MRRNKGTEITKRGEKMGKGEIRGNGGTEIVLKRRNNRGGEINKRKKRKLNC
jgi:hypothetical protein